MIKILKYVLYQIFILLSAYIVGRAFVFAVLTLGGSVELIARAQFVLSNIFIGLLLFIIAELIVAKLSKKGYKHD